MAKIVAFIRYTGGMNARLRMPFASPCLAICMAVALGFAAVGPSGSAAAQDSAVEGAGDTLDERRDALRQRLDALEAALADANDLTADALAATVEHLGRLESRLDDVGAAVARGDRAAEDALALAVERGEGIEQTVTSLSEAAETRDRASDDAIADLAVRVDGLERAVADAASAAPDRGETPALDSLAARFDTLEQRLATLEDGADIGAAAGGPPAHDIDALAIRIEAIGETVAALEAVAGETMEAPAEAETPPGTVDGFAAKVVDRFVEMVRRLREANAGPSLRPSL